MESHTTNEQMKAFHLQQHSKNSLHLYDEVMAKNFEIIQNFLKKFHTIFLKQQEFEHTIIDFSEKIMSCQRMVDEMAEQNRNFRILFEDKLYQIKAKSSIRTSNSSQRRQTRQSIFCFPPQVKKTSQFKNIQNNQLSSEQTTQLKAQIKELRQKLTDINQHFTGYCSTIENQIKKQCESRAQSQINISHRLTHQEEIFIGKQWNIQKQQMITQIEELIRQNNERYREINHQAQFKVYYYIFIENEINHINSQILTVKQQIKNQTNKIIEQTVQIFANKAQTKRALLLLEKKVQKINFKNTTQETQNFDPCVTVKGSKCLSCCNKPRANTAKHFPAGLNKPKQSHLLPKKENQISSNNNLDSNILIIDKCDEFSKVMFRYGSRKIKKRQKSIKFETRTNVQV